MKGCSFSDRAVVLSNNYFFSSVDKNQLSSVCENYCTDRIFKKGQLVFSRNSKEKCIGVIADGTVSVKKEHIVINHLTAGDIFGAVTLYNDCEEFVNDIIAQSECTVVFISKEGVDSLISRSHEFAKGYIKYLSQRIYFLNDKIEEYTAPTAKGKLLAYFERNSDGGRCVMSGKMTELSKQLNLSRASLYRALDELCADGKIEKDGDIICLL